MNPAYCEYLAFPKCFVITGLLYIVIIWVSSPSLSFLKSGICGFANGYSFSLKEALKENIHDCDLFVIGDLLQLPEEVVRIHMNFAHLIVSFSLLIQTLLFVQRLGSVGDTFGVFFFFLQNFGDFLQFK